MSMKLHMLHCCGLLHILVFVHEVPFDVKNDFELLDMHSHTNEWSFACTTVAGTIAFNGGTAGVVVPYRAIVWQLQTRVLLHGRGQLSCNL